MKKRKEKCDQTLDARWRDVTPFVREGQLRQRQTATGAAPPPPLVRAPSAAQGRSLLAAPGGARCRTPLGAVRASHSGRRRGPAVAHTVALVRGSREQVERSALSSRSCWTRTWGHAWSTASARAARQAAAPLPAGGQPAVAVAQSQRLQRRPERTARSVEYTCRRRSGSGSAGPGLASRTRDARDLSQHQAVGEQEQYVQVCSAAAAARRPGGGPKQGSRRGSGRGPGGAAAAAAGPIVQLVDALPHELDASSDV